MKLDFEISESRIQKVLNGKPKKLSDFSPFHQLAIKKFLRLLDVKPDDDRLPLSFARLFDDAAIKLVAALR